MIYRIVQYIQPWEIDQLERQINKMIPSSYLIEDRHTVIWDVSMNLEIVDWSKSSISKQFFIDKFNNLKYTTSIYFKEEFTIDEEIKGAADKKRDCSNKNQDYTIWLDSDIYFPESCLAYIVKTTENLDPKKHHIITPEIIKYWDNSWDCITHQKFLNEPFNQRDYFDLYSLDSILSQCDIQFDELPRGILKFGAGWFTTLSDKLIKDVKLPKELGSYGPDDTYVMLCSKKFGTVQYIIRGVVVSEIGKKYEKFKDYYKPQLNIKIKDRVKISDQEFQNLVIKFYENK